MRSYKAIVRLGRRNRFTRAGLLVSMFVVIFSAASALSAAAQGLFFSDDFEDGILLDDWETGNPSWSIRNGRACQASSDGPLVSVEPFIGPVSGSVEITQSSLALNRGIVGFSPKAAVSPGLEIQAAYMAVVRNFAGDIIGQILQFQLAPGEDFISVEDRFPLAEIPTRLGLNVNAENLEYVADGQVLLTVPRVPLPLIGDKGAIFFGATLDLPGTTCFDNVVLTALEKVELKLTNQFGTAGVDRARATTVDATGVYVAGEVEGTLPGETSAGGIDAFVRKYDSDGNVLWTDQFGTAGVDVAYGISTTPSLTGEVSIYVVGATGGTFPGETSAGADDFFIRKYDSDGNLLATEQDGTSGADILCGISTSPGLTDLYVVGSVGDALPGESSAGGADVILRKYDSDLNEVFSDQFGSSGNDIACGIQTTPGLTGEVSIFVAGVAGGALPGESSAGGDDAFLKKYDSDLTALRTVQFGSPLDDGASSVGITPESKDDPLGIFVGGVTNGALPGQTNLGGSDAYVRRYDTNLDPVWTRQFGTTGDEPGIVVGNSPVVFVAGGTTGIFPGRVSAGGTDIFFRTYDFDGNVIVTRQFGTPGDDQPLGAHTSFDSLSLFVVGETDGTFTGETSAGGIDAFLVEVATLTLELIEALQDVTVDLQEIVDNNPGTPLADKVEDALAKAQTALEELNKTPPDNQAAAENIEGSVGDLEAALGLDPAQDPAVTDLMDQLASIARQLAADATSEAFAQGGDTAKINEAQQALANGDALRALGAFKDAVNKYKEALAKAESALP